MKQGNYFMKFVVSSKRPIKVKFNQNVSYDFMEVHYINKVWKDLVTSYNKYILVLIKNDKNLIILGLKPGKLFHDFFIQVLVVEFWSQMKDSLV